ncbi:hypothetical protein ABN763_04530 [Spongiivirga sp. MCCC 1A20706]|uniref:hypothetical protein n=1 Tax=Spongiivirga sp. MCCC 1A20706 TaxID=3160963 RepID=UPI003977A7E7
MNSNVKISNINAITKLLAVVLFGSALLGFSINSITAKSNDNTFDFPETLSKDNMNMIQSSNGRYQMNLQIVEDSEDKKIYWMVLVWDTQTGKSKLYSKDQNKGTVPAHSGWQLPASPL